MRVEAMSEAKGMEPKQEQRLSREEFDRISSEIRALIGDKLRGHKDGDAERLLFKTYRRPKVRGSNAGR
jgi:hypothetical protein